MRSVTDRFICEENWCDNFKSVCLQDDAKSPGEAVDEEDGGKRSSKRRKVLSAKDTATPAPEVKPGSADDNAVTEESGKGVCGKTVGLFIVI